MSQLKETMCLDLVSVEAGVEPSGTVDSTNFFEQWNPVPRNFNMPVAGGLGYVVEGVIGLAESTDPLRRDFAEKNSRERALAVGSTAAALAFLAANATSVRSLVTPLEMHIAHETNPLVAGAAGAAVSWAWYRPYAHTIRHAAQTLPHTLSAAANHLPVDKANVLPGLQPQAELPTELTQSHCERIKHRFERGFKRSCAMQATTTLTYTVSAALQEQSQADQKKLCNETSNETAASSFIRTSILTGSVALIGLVDTPLGQDIMNNSHGLKGVALFGILPVAIMGGVHQLKKSFRRGPFVII